MKTTVDKLVDHLEWLRGEVGCLQRQLAEPRWQTGPLPQGLWVHKYNDENMEDIYQARNEYRTALEDIATSAADKETLKAVAREVLERWREEVGE